MQAAKVTGGREAFCRELLLTCPAMLRSSYSASQAAQAADR